jgi:hypothetical protein
LDVRPDPDRLRAHRERTGGLSTPRRHLRRRRSTPDIARLTQSLGSRMVTLFADRFERGEA